MISTASWRMPPAEGRRWIEWLMSRLRGWGLKCRSLLRASARTCRTAGSPTRRSSSTCVPFARTVGLSSLSGSSDTSASIERRLDYDFGGRRKRSRAEGGLFDGDLALRAGRAAFADAGVDAADIDVLVHVTTTPDLIACQDHFRFLATELGLRRDVDLVHHNLGCAGLAAGIPHRRVLARFDGARRPRWSSPAIARRATSGLRCTTTTTTTRAAWDGWRRSCSPTVRGLPCGVRHRVTTAHGPTGLLSVRYETSPDIELVTYPGGGCLHHTSASNVADHVFLMDGVKVAEVFPPLIARDFQMLQEDWPTTVKPFTGADFDVDAVDRWYLHQANGVVVRQAIEMLGLPPERVPISVDHYGNTSAASTLILLDEDRRAGRVDDGDLVVFLWIGAGNGAMNGYAAVAL